MSKNVFQLMSEGNHNMKKFFYNEYVERKELYENSPPVDTNVSQRSLGHKPRDRPVEVTEAELDSPLQILEVVYDVTNFEDHHTEKYELVKSGTPTAIFRRGQTFELFVHVNRMYDPENDKINMSLVYGESNSSYSTGTKYNISASINIEDINKEEWGLLIKDIQESMISLQINIPVKSQVGVWFYRVDTIYKKDTIRYGEEELLFYLIFNPWNKYDEVYLENEHERQKYVLSDYGHILGGETEKICSMPWIYGQFDYVILPAVFRLLANSTLPGFQRGNVVLIAREIAALVNSNDENGLLVGKWTPTIHRPSDVTPPTLWTGSIKIYEEYQANYGRSVKSGQCWVFAGCVTTACRALGIPCRTTTCYQCAHDSDKTLTIDYYYNKYGQRINTPNFYRDDTAPWNFHCWNEVWFARKDLQGYDGWQVIDATPQEKSEGRFTLGPAPIKAVHRGDVGVKYDVDFVFSEVNADICHLYEDPNSEWGFSVKQIETAAVGKYIGTFDFDSSDQIKDLTSIYKYSEGSVEERETFYKAISQTPRAQKFYKLKDFDEPLEDMDFKLSKSTSLNFGNAFDISVFVKNKSNEVRQVVMIFEANAVDSTGQKLYEKIKRVTKDIVLEPLAESIVSVEVTQNDYQHSRRFTPLYEVVADCKVKETRQVYRSKEFFNISLPNLTIAGPGIVQVNVLSSLSISFKNPLDQALTNCMLIIESPRIQRPKILPLRDVPPRGKMTEDVSINPKRMGKTQFVAILNTDQLGRIEGHTLLEVLGQ